MQANELRIGNWISFDNGGAYIVNSIQGNQIGIHNNPNYFQIGNATGIPLDETWLKKFGFFDDNKGQREKYEHTTYINWCLRGNTPISNYFRVYEELDEKRWIYKDIRGIEYGRYMVYANMYWTQSVKYVHELQNLYFALTGEELSETVKEK